MSGGMPGRREGKEKQRSAAASAKRIKTASGTTTVSAGHSSNSSSSKKSNSSGLSGKRRTDGNAIVKGNWTDQEDAHLVQLVHCYLDIKEDGSARNSSKPIASTRWSEIAKQLPGRVGKQCRERWHNHLRPDINKGRWTFVEEVVIYVCWRRWGSQWARIARLLDGRSDNRVKNHWNCHMKRRLCRDPIYAQFMEECNIQTAADAFPEHLYEDDFEDVRFRSMLLPKIDKHLSDHHEQLQQMPCFSANKRDAKQQPDLSPSSHQAVKMRLPSPPKRVLKTLKKVKKRACRDATFCTLDGESMSRWSAQTGEENKLGREFAPPTRTYHYYPQHDVNYRAIPAEENQPELLLCAPGSPIMSPAHPFSTHSYPSPANHYSSELEESAAQVSYCGDPLWSGAVSSDFSIGSPAYFGKTMTSTPLKQMTPFNVPLASECGAMVFSPLNSCRYFSGSLYGSSAAEEKLVTSPVRRAFCGLSNFEPLRMWTPTKDQLANEEDVLSGHHSSMASVRLGSIVIKTPQPIREALANSLSEANRTISPEDLSPGRWFSDASELISGELNQSGELLCAIQRNNSAESSNSLILDSMRTPEMALSKCRRRLIDQWSMPTSSTSTINSSGYGSFQMTPTSQHH